MGQGIDIFVPLVIIAWQHLILQRVAYCQLYLFCAVCAVVQCVQIARSAVQLSQYNAGSSTAPPAPGHATLVGLMNFHVHYCDSVINLDLQAAATGMRVDVRRNLCGRGDFTPLVCLRTLYLPQTTTSCTVSMRRVLSGRRSKSNNSNSWYRRHGLHKSYRPIVCSDDQYAQAEQ